MDMKRWGDDTGAQKLDMVQWGENIGVLELDMMQWQGNTGLLELDMCPRMVLCYHGRLIWKFQTDMHRMFHDPGLNVQCTLYTWQCIIMCFMSSNLNHQPWVQGHWRHFSAGKQHPDGSTLNIKLIGKQYILSWVFFFRVLPASCHNKPNLHMNS